MINNKVVFLTVILVLIFLSSTVFSLETSTHEAINIHISSNTINNFSLDNYLKTHLGFSKGIDEKIYLTKEVWRWLGEGGIQEDEPDGLIETLLDKGRSNNHFHNPLKSSEEWEDAGLNDTVLGISYTGQSQVLWAQNPNQNIGGKWEGMKGKLLNKDVNGALAFIISDSQKMFRYNFELLKDYLPTIVQSMLDMHLDEIENSVAKYHINAIQDNVESSFYIEFIKDRDGIWKIVFF